jgi:A/G-specific adenine glycosylase
MSDKVSTRFFSEQLLRWHQIENDRSLPWKFEKDPYRIWLSEIILQQTRAEQGQPYYERFVQNYPDIHALAAAPDEEVFRLWQGLGYYNRCRNLLFTARYISRERNGQFPDTLDGLLELNGVGSYTAAAIASFAFNLPHAVIDGNVKRVLSRFFGIHTPVDSPAGLRQMTELATTALDTAAPAAYNQAIMDFGASVCKPQLPLCPQCPLADRCSAYQHGQVQLLPVKEKRVKVRKRHFHYFLLQHEGKVYIAKRTANDIWQNLFEYYLIETADDFRATDAWKSLLPYIDTCPKPVWQGKQRLTHQLIISNFYLVSLKARPQFLDTGSWIDMGSEEKYAFPKTILSFSARKKYF